MRCDQAREALGRLLDGELSAGEREAVLGHADGCAECARHRDELIRLRRHLQPLRELAPLGLATRLSAALAVEASDEAAVLPSRLALPPLVVRARRACAPYVAKVAALLVACGLSIAGTAWWMQGASLETALSRDAHAAHVRSLIQDHAVQVASLDTHTVKPWFAGRLDYAPSVKDLSREGFQLVGGRLDYVGGRRVAALVYRRRLHQISMFVWPSATLSTTVFSTKIDGFNLLSWSKDGMTYWIVSDLNEGELREFQGLV